jgi:AraC-like DNA-binding protein
MVLDTFVLSIQCAFRWLTANPLPIECLSVGLPVGEYRKSLLHGLFDCPVAARGSDVIVTYSLALAKLPLAPVKYDAWAAHEYDEFMKLLNESATRFSSAEPKPAVKIVADIRRQVADGARTEKEIAARLCMSPTTMRRRLLQYGSSLRDLLDGAQREAAASLLATDKPLEDIAAEVHYSDVRSFRRACIRWFGMTPAAYRKAERMRTNAVGGSDMQRS